MSNEMHNPNNPRCPGYHGPRPCDYAESDGNRDDPTYFYCGHQAGHAGPHGHWFM